LPRSIVAIWSSSVMPISKESPGAVHERFVCPQ
jgi:hypothetical protein